MRKHLYILLIAFPFINTDAQSVKSPEETILTYRSIALQDSTQLGLLQNVFTKCVDALGNEYDCVRLVGSVFRGIGVNKQDWHAVLHYYGRQPEEIAFMQKMKLEEIAAIISYNRLVSLQLEKVLSSDNRYTFNEKSAAHELLRIMDLQPEDRIGVLQQNADIKGELISSAGLTSEVTVFVSNIYSVESLHQLLPESSEPSWKAPRYVYKEDLKISDQYRHDKVFLNEVLSHNEKVKPMLRKLVSTLKINDEVILFEHIETCCTHGERCKEAKSGKEIERLFTSRSFRLIEKTEVGHYLMARFIYAPF